MKNKNFKNKKIVFKILTKEEVENDRCKIYEYLI